MNFNLLFSVPETEQTPSHILMQIQKDSYTEEQLETFENILNHLQNVKSQYLSTLYSFSYETNVITKFEFLCIRFDGAYKKSLSTYHQTNSQILVEELLAELIDLVECYNVCVELNFPIVLNPQNMSVSMRRKQHMPYPQICISPYAFIDGFLSLIDEEEELPNVHQSFAPLFEMFDQMLIQRYGGNGFISDIVMGLNQGMDMRNEIGQHGFFKYISDSLRLDEFNLQEYKLVKSLGKGNSGSVVCVEKIGTNQLYAIKESDNYHIESLFKEAFVMKSMNHPNIVKFHAFTVQNFSFLNNQKPSSFPHGFLLMEYCPCGDLDSYITQRYQSGNGIAFNEIFIIFGQIVEACLYHHNVKRYIHRDLKLENILIISLTPFPLIKIADYGFSRAIDTVMKTYLGTGYTADIRILEKKEYDEKSDLFSLGCILYFLFYGRYPCDGCRNFDEIVKKMNTKEITFQKQHLNDPVLKEMVNLIIHLIRLNDKSMTWDQFMNNPFVEMCRKLYNQALVSNGMK